MYSAIILSGGKGKRMEKSLPKQYLLLAGKPMIMHSLERIDSIDEINEVVIVCEKEYVETVKLMAEQYNINTPICFADAGITRQNSVYSGLQKVSNNMVILHEAARPFIKCEDFLKLIRHPAENVTFGYSIPFTVVQGKETINQLLDRNNLVNIQLPQKFNTALLRRAHEIALQENKFFTEDAGLVYELTGEKVEIIRGASQNIKITEPIDMTIGEVIYNEYIKGRR